MSKHNQVTIKGHKYYRKQITCPDGKRKNLYADTVGELREKEARFRAELQEKSKGNGLTVAGYAAQQLQYMQARVQQATYTGYEEKVRLYIAASPLGDKPLTEVTADDIHDALLRVVPLSASTYRTVHMLFRRIFGAAKRSHLITDDPTDGISSKGGKPAVEKEALSDEEVNILLNAVERLPVETFVRLGLHAGLRREEILGLQWDCVHLETENPYIQVRRAWRIEHNRPVVSERLKTPAAKRDIPIPPALADHLRVKMATATGDYVVANHDGGPLTGSQWRNLWKQVTVRSTAERTYTRYFDGKKVTHTVTPKLGEQAAHNPGVVYSMDFKVTPHQLRHTYITNLIHSGVDPKTVQYLAGHDNAKITMDIYAKVKYNRPEDIAPKIKQAFGDNATEESKMS